MLLTDIHPHGRPFLLVIFSLVIVALLPSLVLAQQATLTDDAQTSTANPNQNFGSKVSVQVSGSTFKGFLKFKLTPILPTGTTGGRIEKATLKLFVTSVITAGAAEVYRVAGAWDEGSITNNTAPALGSLLTSLSFDATSEDRWVSVDITPLVKDWLDNVLPNNGIALIAGPGGLNVTFNSKENGTTSHEPVLEVLVNHVATADHATTADNATTADTANALSGSATVNASQVNGAFTNATIAGSSITDVVPISNGGTGSSTQNFVDLSTNQTVAGNKIFNGPVDTNAHYRIGGVSILSNPGTSNLFAGIGAGSSNTSGSSNSFFGLNAGRSNTSSSGNSFFGAFAGEANTTGRSNSFFGNLVGKFNSSGNDNSFFGQTSGLSNTTGNANSFFGFNTGNANTGGGENSFFGNRSGQANTSGDGNSFFGSGTGLANTTASGNSFFGWVAGESNTTGDLNTFVGASAGQANTTASRNAFFGVNSGARSNGDGNAFFGVDAGVNNTTGPNNTFVGFNAGASNSTGGFNTYLGFNAGGATDLTNATAIGANSTVNTSNTMVLGTNSVTVEVPGNLTVANSFSANGANLTNLNASNITSGTLDNTRLGVVPIVNGGTGSSNQNFVDLSTSQTVSGNKAFNNNVTVGNSSTGGSLTLTNTVNRFLELGSNVGFDSVAGTVVGIRLKSTQPLENYSYGIFHGSNVFPGALIFRKDDLSISPGDARNRLIIASNGDVIVNSGNLGVGITTPGFKLDVVGDTNLSGTLNVGSHVNMNGNLFVRNSLPQVNLYDSTGQNMATFHASTGLGATVAIGSLPGIPFVIRSGGLDSIWIDPTNQRVGVGTTSPTERLEVAGNLRINGDFVATGTKSAVVTLSDKREVKLYAVESPGNWFEDFGSARLTNGTVTVSLDPLFAETVNTGYTYHVFLTANGNCRGLYVAKKTATSFEVRELGGGRSEITFDYRIVARRRGYEQVTSR